MIKSLRNLFYFFHHLTYLRFLRSDLVFVDLDFTLFDNSELLKSYPNEDFYSLNITLNQSMEKELNKFKKNNIYLFTARGVINSAKTNNQLKKNDFINFNKILFIGSTEYKFLFLKINDIFFKKNIVLYDDFQDYIPETSKLIQKYPPNFKFTKHIHPQKIN